MFWPVLLMFAFFLVVLNGFALLLGFVVHWMVPSVDIGSGSILGVLTTAMALLVSVFLLRDVKHHQQAEAEEDLEDLLREYQAQRKSRRKKR
jgi:uncharacterized membrane protein (DUF485 family)